jgi:Zn-dependent protease with chaperone function
MTAEPHAILFGDRLPAQGVQVRVQLGANGLELHERSGTVHRVAYDHMEIKRGGWRGDALLLEWSDAGNARSLTLSDLDPFSSHIDQLPLRMRRLLEEWRGRSRRSAWKLRALVAGGLALVLVPLVAFGVLFVNGQRLAGMAVERIPVTWEQEVGESAAQQLQQDPQLLPEGDITRMVEDIGSRLLATVSTPYAYRFFVVQNTEANAFAMPGGTIVVWTGLLLEIESAEELAGVLAHEIQHVQLRHSTRALVQSLGLRVTLTILLGSFGDAGGVVGNALGQLGDMRFSRSQEAEADQYALDMLAGARIDPAGLATFFDHLGRTHRAPPEFLSTHPSSRDRAEQVRERITPGTIYEPLPYDWAAVRAALQPPAPAPVPAPAP